MTTTAIPPSMRELGEKIAARRIGVPPELAAPYDLKGQPQTRRPDLYATLTGTRADTLILDEVASPRAESSVMARLNAIACCLAESDGHLAQLRRAGWGPFDELPFGDDIGQGGSILAVLERLEATATRLLNHSLTLGHEVGA